MTLLEEPPALRVLERPASEMSAPDGSLAAPSASRAPEGSLAAVPVAMAVNGKKVLLLEDDASFKEIMQCFLTENDFSVVAVQNGVEGVHEVLASDFEVILCDMLMPTLPGDMFFRAVERMRPHLCDRFIFMTGYRGNSKVNEFIAGVNGTVLTKPFHVDDLLELIAFVELRTFLLAA
jgi:CheY-like chemotaxis protein